MPAEKGTPGREVSNANLRRGETVAPKGNVRTLKSGAWSTVAVEPFRKLWSSEFFDQLAEDSPLRENPDYRHWVATASLVFARLQSAGSWLDTRMGDLGNAEVLRALEEERKLRREATEVLERLKLAPLSPSDDLAVTQMIADLEERFGVLKSERDAAIADAVALRAALAQAIPVEEVADAAEVS